MSLDSLTTDLRLLAETVNSAFDALANYEPETGELERLAVLKVEADDINRSWVLTREALDNRLGDAMGGFETVVEGVGQIKRHKKKSRTKWDKDDLKRAVLDTRLVTPDGELVEETPLDKVLAVFPLGTPRSTAAKARGLDVDDFCAVEVKGGWQIEVR